MDSDVSRPCTIKIDWLIENLTCLRSVGSISSPDTPLLPGFKATLAFLDSSYEVTFASGEDDLGEGGEVIRSPISEELESLALRFRFYPPRSDVVSVCMSTVLDVLSDVSATFSRPQLKLGDLCRSDRLLLLAIRNDRPEGKEEQVHLERFIERESNVVSIGLGMRGAFRGLSFRARWDLYAYDESLLDSRVVFGKFGDDVDEWRLADNWEEALLTNQGSHVRIRLQCFTDRIRSSIKSGRVWRRKESFRNVEEKVVARTSSETENWAVLRKELVSMYRNRLFTDFELRCGGAAISVHRSVLSARSPVFRAMMSSDMMERTARSADIEDLDVATLRQLLEFVYTGAVEEGLREVESAAKLYYAADKYQVSNLKTECSEFLAANVSVSNACDLLALGDRHADSRLTSAVQKFILWNFREVSRSEEWQRYTTTDPELLVKTVTYFAANGCYGDIFSLSSS